MNRRTAIMDAIEAREHAPAIPDDTPYEMRSKRALMAYLRAVQRDGRPCEFCDAPAVGATQTPWGPALVCRTHEMRSRR